LPFVHVPATGFDTAPETEPPLIGTVPDPSIPFPGIDPSEILPIATVGAAALSAAIIVRGVCSPTPAVMFTNVRLLPCYVNATVQQTTTTATSVISRIVGDGAAAVRDAGRGGGAIVGSVRDGFERALDGPRPQFVEEDSFDRRLLTQLGIVLGTIYLAFLTVWFWATRLRWNPRT
jgi:hypothetical protein